MTYEQLIKLIICAWLLCWVAPALVHAFVFIVVFGACLGYFWTLCLYCKQLKEKRQC